MHKLMILMECSILLLILAHSCYMLGEYKGKTTAYDNIISEKCWLNKQTRDIECINYIN